VRQRPSAAVLTAGIDHVRLLYHYIDTGDMDGCGSLLDDDVRLWSPGAPVGRGRGEVTNLQRGLASPLARHQTDRMIAAGDAIAVAGRLVRRAGVRSGADAESEDAETVAEAEDVEFADFFTVSGEGMLLTQHRYYFVPPG
jgi:hypothetical protein